MSLITCKFVRPDKLVYQGHVKSLILVTSEGELGVWPGHASEICSLGDGVVRLRLTPEDGGEERKVIISGGYAEINPGGVIILADHARDVDDIDPDTVRRTRQKAFDLRDEVPEGDHRRAYYDNKTKGCNLLLKHASDQNASS
jgi:F-type H+-transporting ATPase subunit epsilon